MEFSIIDGVEYFNGSPLVRISRRNEEDCINDCTLYELLDGYRDATLVGTAFRQLVELGSVSATVSSLTHKGFMPLEIMRPLKIILGVTMSEIQFIYTQLNHTT